MKLVVFGDVKRVSNAPNALRNGVVSSPETLLVKDDPERIATTSSLRTVATSSSTAKSEYRRC